MQRSKKGNAWVHSLGAQVRHTLRGHACGLSGCQLFHSPFSPPCLFSPQKVRSREGTGRVLRHCLQEQCLSGSPRNSPLACFSMGGGCDCHLIKLYTLPSTVLMTVTCQLLFIPVLSARSSISVHCELTLKNWGWAEAWPKRLGWKATLIRLHKPHGPLLLQLDPRGPKVLSRSVPCRDKAPEGG